MINLFDSYNQNSWDLHYSLLVSGYKQPSIALNDDGFLPYDVTSPYLFFTDFAAVSGRPLYFNELRLPPYWEIRTDRNQAGIWDLGRQRGRIRFFQTDSQRVIKEVDWLDDRKERRLTDCYNRVGFRFSQISYNTSGQPVLRSYFDRNNQEVLLENYITGNLILNYQQQVFIFKNKLEFWLFYLEAAQFNLDRIFYNSLGHPFLLAQSLQHSGEDVLFWQENSVTALSDNMKKLFHQNSRSTKIAVQHSAVYQKLQQSLTETEASLTDYLGFLYPFKRENQGRSQVLIVTYSDQLQDLTALVTNLPEVSFHIAAPTEMSSKLLAYKKYANVRLYPRVDQSRLSQLYQACDFYLDINHGREVPAALRRAFENKMIIFAFSQTAHNHRYIAPNHRFQTAEELLFVFLQVLAHPPIIPSLLKKQYEGADLATVQDYQKFIG
ncbi:accessory Sec system glycosylation chaperone GtfB [Streptococcus pantholopis]|uniref:UDP-N-acetylglucosamine--peptide N-acetylglucosaminyltransferase stabilizing protein GtfB n=1 Tax=Streptococcus pantholopis TaxID=1811193 RepID=A0A172Q5W8_9STRE|nr:accessory Sec system glycosylation chaperone GtfB [Streptococcus pantholopis]AND78871.1 hypothetical protein A0O21_01940 [Streptococcus pantholopis]